MALLRSIRSSLEGDPYAATAKPPVNEGAAPEFVDAPAPHDNLPDILRARPSDRPPPRAVNEFLQEEQSLNSGRLDLLRQRQIKIEDGVFSARCLPQWDFRSLKREVIWFYHYRSGSLVDGPDLTVFGAVDGLGQPLFQHPPMAGDPLALLDSQYKGLKWIALEEPRLALIAASNGPWPTSGAILDFFLVNETANDQGSRFWRFDDACYPEQPPSSARLIRFHDADGDGLLDLCAFWITGEADEATPAGRCHPYLPEDQTFATGARPLSQGVLAALQLDYERLLSGEKLPEPYFTALPATERLFTTPAPDPEDPPQENAGTEDPAT